MKHHLKIIWGGPEVITGRWYLRLIGFYSRTEGAHDDGLAISIRGLLPWLFGAVAATWLLGAAALFQFWQRDPYSLRTFSDALFFPVRRAEIQDKNGQALIARGTDALREKKWSDVVPLLRQGLVLHPKDWRARLLLAQFYVATNQRAMALRQLQEGLTDEYPGRAYLAGILAIAEQGEDHDTTLKVARRYLPRLQGDAMRSDRRWLQAREFAALMATARFDEALACAATAGPGHVGQEQRVLALLELRRPADALSALAEWRELPGGDVAGMTRLSARAFREAGRFADMEGALDKLRKIAPTEPKALVFGMIQQALAERDAQSRALLEDFLFRFGGSNENLQTVAEALAEVGKPALLERCVAAAAERGYPAPPFQALLLQGRVRCGEWSAAARTLAEMTPRSGTAVARDQLGRDWMARLLDAVQPKGNATSLALVDFLRNRPWPVKMFQTTVEALRRAQQLETARDVIGVARATFPASAWAEQQGIEVAQELAARPPVQAAPIAAKGSLPVQRLFFERLDEALSNEQWTVAGQLIRDARVALPEPLWLNSREGDLGLAAMRVAQGLGEGARMFSEAQLYLNGDPVRSRMALDFARKFYARGDQDSAIALVNAVLRRSPEHVAARKLMSEWRPKPVPSPKAVAKLED